MTSKANYITIAKIRNKLFSGIKISIAGGNHQKQEICNTEQEIYGGDKSGSDERGANKESQFDAVEKQRLEPAVELELGLKDMLQQVFEDAKEQ